MTRDRGAVRVSLNEESLTRAAAELFLSVVNEAVGARGRADIALTGGSSPGPMHRLLTTPEFVEQIPWDAVHIWFGDERAVPPDDPLSNYGAAHDTLLAHVPLPPANVHRMLGELAPDDAAARYEAELRSQFFLAPGTLPALDLIWLGLGPDGHIASLFPGNASLDVTDRLAIGVVHRVDPEPHVDRVTLTLPVINAAARVAFLISGASKAAIAARAMAEDPAPGEALLPSQRVNPTSHGLLWLLDLDAAGELQ
jgi:6-phosphogluconolactonase